MISRYLLLGIFVLLFLGSCKNKNEISGDSVNNPNTADGNADMDELPKFHFYDEDNFHDFGNVVEGEKISYSFRFKNVGKSVLLISSVKATCGCTVPKYSEDPVNPGEEGIINVTFKTQGRPGLQNKSVTIMANTQPNTEVLRIRATVLKEED